VLLYDVASSDKRVQLEALVVHDPESGRNLLLYDVKKSIKSQTCRKEYKFFTPFCSTSYEIPLGSTFMHQPLSDFWKDYGDLSFVRSLDFGGVLANDDNVWKSVYKMDAKHGLTSGFDPKIFDDAIEMSWSKLGWCLTTPINYAPSFVLNRSATFHFTAAGYKTKGDVLMDPDFYELVWHPFDMLCWWRVSPKHEYLAIEDIINENKIRTFIIPPMHLLFWQKVFGCADENIKKYQPGDIRYGITFQYGGYHRMIMAHGDDPESLIWYTLDASGWDRLIPILNACWDLRRRGLTIPPSIQKFYDWMISNTISSYLLLPNGDVIWKDWGNNSGSGTTTGDNCIMHQIISDYTKIYAQKRNFANIDDHNADLYGDDNQATFPCIWEGKDLDLILESFKQILVDVYGHFGLTIKKHTCVVQKGPIGVQFLGATCTKHGDFYLPAFNSSRIYAAMTTCIDKHSIDDEVSKCYALMHLAWNDIELFDILYNMLFSAMRDTSVQGSFLNSVRKRGLPSREEVINRFWIGTEAESIFAQPNFALESISNITGL